MKGSEAFILSNIVENAITSYKEYKIEELKNQTERQLSRDQKEVNIAAINAMRDVYINSSNNQLKKDLLAFNSFTHLAEISLMNNDHRALEMILDRSVQLLTYNYENSGNCLSGDNRLSSRFDYPLLGERSW